eukprot:1801667-Pyramimonas_sp.AAC.1
MQPVLSAVQNIQQRQRTQDDMIKQMLDHMAYNSSMLAALQKLYQQTPQAMGLTTSITAPATPTAAPSAPRVPPAPPPTAAAPPAQLD